MARRHSLPRKDLEFMAQDIGAEILPYLKEEDLLKRLSPEARLRGLNPEDLLKHLSPEARLRGLNPEDLLRYLTPEARRTLQQLLAEQEGKSEA